MVDIVVLHYGSFVSCFCLSIDLMVIIGLDEDDFGIVWA